MKPLHPNKEEQDGAVRRGPWTLDEDNLLIHYITSHGEGRWNLLAKSAGLKRTGKSCRLRWLNYLKPDIKRGNLTLQEQLLILELQTKWGNRWSKIAQHLPGRTDNEIKNYWRTRVQKHAKQLNMEPNSQSFFDAIKCYYIPRLVQKIEQNSFSSSITDHQESGASLFPPLQVENDYSDQSFNENSSSSVTPLSIYSSECSKILNPIEDSWNPSNPFNGYTSGKVSQFKAVDPALSSDVYYVGNSSYDMSAMGQRSNAYVADDSWISNEMADDTWIRDGLW